MNTTLFRVKQTRMRSGNKFIHILLTFHKDFEIMLANVRMFDTLLIIAVFTAVWNTFILY